jgi:hypothetical protein
VYLGAPYAFFNKVLLLIKKKKNNNIIINRIQISATTENQTI